MPTDECRVGGRGRCERGVTGLAPGGSRETWYEPTAGAWKSSHILVTIADWVRTILATMSMDVIKNEQQDTAPTELVAGTVGDRCTHCQKPLASDQRYCVNCGTRRGKPRFSFDSMAAQAKPAEAPEPKPHRSRVSSATTLVAGIATLLLAMGVGVLIGHNSNSTPTRASAPAIVTVGGGGTAASGVAATGGGAAAASTKHHAKAGKTKQVVVHLNGAVKAKASAAANKVFGSNAGNLVNDPTVQPGQACSGGAGCENHKFTGNFFPGG